MADVHWWLDYLEVFNGKTKIINDREGTSLTIDACNKAAGGVYGPSFFHLPWDRWPGSEDLHINVKEVLALEPAVLLWGSSWEGKTVYVHSDNQCAVAVITKGSSQNKDIMASLRRVFWSSISSNFRLRARYYPGVDNKHSS